MVSNPKFPHSCKVIRMSPSDPNDAYSSPVPSIILESECQNQINEVGDTVFKEGQAYSDYTTYLPLFQNWEELAKNGNAIPVPTIPDGVQVIKGDTIEVVDSMRNLILTVSQSEKGNIGIRIWANGDKGEQ